MRTCFILIALLFSACLLPGPGFGKPARLAVLPLEDVSRGANGVNLEVSKQVATALRHHGVAVADHDEVIAFMVRNRVRWLGHLGSQYVRRLRNELDVDYALLGSVNQRREDNPRIIGLTLQVIRTADAKIVWARSAELSNADEIGLLGLGQSEDIGEMEHLVVERALQSLPADLATYGGPLEIRQGVDSVDLEPQILTPGSMVLCRVKLSYPPQALFNTTVSIFVDDRIVEATYQEDENSYLATWPAARRNGRYPVLVSISRPDSLDKEVLVGSYLVDGQAPVLDLQVKGQELGGIVVLQKNVDIMPLLKHPEPISRWQMLVRDNEGLEIMGDDGRDGLPDRFSWWGQAKNGALVADGFYSLELTVWDRAGNRASAQESIKVVRQEPQVQLAMKEQDDKVAVNLMYDGEIPLAYWRLEIRTKEGELLSETSGTEVPDGGLHLPLTEVTGQNIQYCLYAQDMLGNRLRRQVGAMIPVDQDKAAEGGSVLAEAADKQEMAAREIWTEDF